MEDDVLFHHAAHQIGARTIRKQCHILTAMAFNYVYATYLIPGIGMQDEMSKILAAIARSPLNIAAMFFAIVVAAPVVEELLFRGMLQNALAKYLPIWGAILLSSFL